MTVSHGKNVEPWHLRVYLGLGGFVAFSHGKNFGPWHLRA